MTVHAPAPAHVHVHAHVHVQVQVPKSSERKRTLMADATGIEEPPTATPSLNLSAVVQPPPESLRAYGLATPRAQSLEVMTEAQDDESPADGYDDVILLNVISGDGRTIRLEVGEHGLSLRDPAGALLKILPMEHVTAWGQKPSKIKDSAYFVIQTSTDLETFRKMVLRTTPTQAAAIAESLQSRCELRADAVRAEEAQAQMRRKRSSLLGIFSDRFSGRRSSASGSPQKAKKSASYESAPPAGASVASP